jgi:hypothetical protein
MTDFIKLDNETIQILLEMAENINDEKLKKQIQNKLKNSCQIFIHKECMLCKFYNNPAYLDGNCQRHAPVNCNINVPSAFPPVNSTDCCGDWEILTLPNAIHKPDIYAFFFNFKNAII